MILANVTTYSDGYYTILTANKNYSHLYAIGQYLNKFKKNNNDYSPIIVNDYEYSCIYDFTDIKVGDVISVNAVMGILSATAFIIV